MKTTIVLFEATNELMDSIEGAFRASLIHNISKWHIVETQDMRPQVDSLPIGAIPITHKLARETVITDTITGLERGSLIQNQIFDTLVERVALLFTSYTPEELEQAKLNMAPVELVANLETFLQKWAPLTKRWELAMLPRLLAELPVEAPLAVYGPGPNWLYGALAAHVGRQPFYQFDPRIGWLTPPLLQISTENSSEVQTEVQSYEQATILSLRILNDHLDYLQADRLPFPPIPGERGLILDGRLPHWLLTALVRLYHHTNITWIACRQIQLEGAVIVASHTPKRSPGDFVPLPLS